MLGITVLFDNSAQRIPDNSVQRIPVYSALKIPAVAL